jgi:hypothetical protein
MQAPGSVRPDYDPHTLWLALVLGLLAGGCGKDLTPQRSRYIESMLRRVAKPLASVILLVLVTAWSPAGHRTVAQIAWDNMTARARARAVALLLRGPARARLASLYPADGTSDARGRALFLNAATWPDLVRNRTADWNVYNRPTWHYADFYWSASDGPVHDLAGPAAVNAGERITALRVQLADPRVADTTKAVALAWLLHLVGDIHQPLHCSSRVTIADPLPRGDQGGNRFALDDGHNLHAYWDEMLDAGAPRRSDEDSIAYAARSARRIEGAHPRPSVAPLADSLDVALWERECLHVAQTVVYGGLTPGVAPSPDYRSRALEISERQIALAGYRLAGLLNEALR